MINPDNFELTEEQRREFLDAVTSFVQKVLEDAEKENCNDPVRQERKSD